jgi:hypothetical protein
MRFNADLRLLLAGALLPAVACCAVEYPASLVEEPPPRANQNRRTKLRRTVGLRLTSPQTLRGKTAQGWEA